MFQYAFGRALSIKHKSELFLDLSWFEENNTSTNRDFQLDLFNTDYCIADKKLIDFYKPIVYRGLNSALIRLNIGALQLPNYFIEKGISFNHSVHRISEKCYLNGYWQSEKYFLEYKNELLSEFELKNYLTKDIDNSILSKIQDTESVSLHIRRSDYNSNVNINIHGVLPISYYQKSIEIINSKFNNPSYFIFSDDIEWAKNTFDFLPGNIHFISKNPNYIDLYLNSKCKHNIIANSTFSWWSAWLNNYPGKIVIAPSNWYSNKRLNDLTFDLLPESWIRI